MNKGELLHFWHPFMDETDIIIKDTNGNIIGVVEPTYYMKKDGTGTIALLLPPNVRIAENNQQPVKEPQSKAEDIAVWVDGSCQGNPGPGGWAYIIKSDTNTKECAQRVKDNTTNNRMELTAALEALIACKALGKTIGVHLYTDSEYMVNIMTGNKRGKANSDIITKLVEISSSMNIIWEHIPRNSCSELTRCDTLAHKAATDPFFVVYNS